MAFIKTKLDDVHEGDVVPEAEYDLRIVKVTEKDSKAGNPMRVVVTKVLDPDYPNALPITHWLLSDEGCEPDIAHLRALEYKRFCVLFELDEDWEPEDAIGAEGRCYVTQEMGDDDSDTLYNRLRLPRLVED